MAELTSFKRWLDNPFPWSACPECDAAINREKVSRQLLRWRGVEAAIMRGDLSIDDDGGPYTASYVCDSCKAPLAAAGNWSSEPAWDEDESGAIHQLWTNIYRPGWLSHFPDLVIPPNSVPVSVKDALRRAAPLFWVDLNACATALRQCIEVFLEEQGVARQEVRQDGTPGRFRPLEERIEQFVKAIEPVSKEAADEYELLLRATKFKGNDATHDSEKLDEHDIHVLSRMIKEVLAMRYPERAGLLAEAAKIIGSRHSKRQRSGSNDTSQQPSASLQSAKTPTGNQSGGTQNKP